MRSNTPEKIFMDWFLWATFSEKFQIATVILPWGQKISSRQRIIWDSGVRDIERYFIGKKTVNAEGIRKKVRDSAKLEIAHVQDSESQL